MNSSGIHSLLNSSTYEDLNVSVTRVSGLFSCVTVFTSGFRIRSGDLFSPFAVQLDPRNQALVLRPRVPRHDVPTGRHGRRRWLGWAFPKSWRFTRASHETRESRVYFFSNELANARVDTCRSCVSIETGGACARARTCAIRTCTPTAASLWTRT